jgi:hypothetical protein
MKIPEPEEVIRHLLGNSTASWKLSDKGKIGESLIAISNLDDLLKPGIFEAIRRLTTRRTTHVFREVSRRAHTDAELELARLVDASGGRSERRSQTAADLVGVELALRVDALESLVALGWAERGYRIKCTRCGLTSFVPLADVTSTANCPGCRGAGKYKRIENGLAVYYRLNSLIDRASDQGVLPHLLAIAALGKLRQHTYALSGVEFAFADGTPGEADIYGIAAGKVVAGEVKTSASEFTNDELQKSVDRSRRLAVDVHVMACVEALPAETLTRAAELTNVSELELITLGPNELRPV